MARFKQETDSTQVKISIKVWESKDEFKAWWLLHMGKKVLNGVHLATDVHTCFLDAMGLMALAKGSSGGVHTDYEAINQPMPVTSINRQQCFTSRVGNHYQSCLGQSQMTSTLNHYHCANHSKNGTSRMVICLSRKKGSLISTVRWFTLIITLE